MAGVNFVFNNQLGRFRARCELPLTNDGLVVVLLEATGLEADATLRDYDDLAALIAGTSNEQTNQARKVFSAGVTITVNDTTDRVDIDIPDQVYTALGGNAIAKLLVCYDPDTTAGTDATIEPLTAHSWDVTPDGSDVTAVIAATGFVGATG